MSDHETPDMLMCLDMGSKELLKLASNAGVSRERGDTKRQTAERIVAQDPALAARLIENDRDVDATADAFRDRRQVGADRIGLDEAMTRARHDGMRSKLHSLRVATEGLTSHEVRVKWEYESFVADGSSSVTNKRGNQPGLTSITITQRDDVESHWILDERAQILLTPHGRCTMADVGGTEYIERNTANPGRKWRRAMSSVERMYNPDA
jgi:hypothetical protein